MLEGPIILRMDRARTFAEAATTPMPGRRAAAGGRGAAGAAAGGAAGARQRASRSSIKREGVVATFDRGSDSDMAAGGSDLSWQQQHPDGGTIFPTGSGVARRQRRQRACRVITLAVEHYNRMVRVLDKSVPVKVELNVETKFYDETTPNGFNTIAEIPAAISASRRSRAARRALRLASVRHRRHRQRDRQRPR